MNKKNRRWIILGGLLVIGLVVLGRSMMPRDDAVLVPATVEAIEPPESPPPEMKPAAVAEATSEASARDREATPEVVSASPQRTPGLHGRVYDEDTTAPIGDAHISAHRQGIDSTNRPAMVQSATDGTFVVSEITSGRIMLSVYARGYVQQNMEIEAREDSPPLEIGLVAGGRITGRLVAADGNTPVAGVAYLSDLDRGHGTGGSTSPTGEFELNDLAPGRYQLTGHSAGGMATREVVVARSQHVDGVLLVLTTGHSIRGVVTGLRPDERERTRVAWSREGDAGGGISDIIQLDDRGAFVIRGVIPGRVYLTAQSDRREMSQMVEMPADSDVTVTLDFPRGARLSGRITRGGEPFPDAPIAPIPPQGAELPASVSGTSTSMEGTYVIEDVPPGKYTLMIGFFRTGPFEISGDTVFDFDVPGGQISGRVLEPGGDPVAGAMIFVWPAEPIDAQKPIPHGSDEKGRFAIFGVEPGEFMLTVYKPGFQMHRQRLSFDTNSKEHTIRLREEPGVELTAHVADTDSPLRRLIAVEVIGTGRGTLLHLQMDDQGTGRLPTALAGSTLRFIAPGCQPITIDRWDGEKLELQLERTKAR